MGLRLALFAFLTITNLSFAIGPFHLFLPKDLMPPREQAPAPRRLPDPEEKTIYTHTYSRGNDDAYQGVYETAKTKFDVIFNKDPKTGKMKVWVDMKATLSTNFPAGLNDGLKFGIKGLSAYGEKKPSPEERKAAGEKALKEWIEDQNTYLKSTKERVAHYEKIKKEANGDKEKWQDYQEETLTEYVKREKTISERIKNPPTAEELGKRMNLDETLPVKADWNKFKINYNGSVKGTEMSSYVLLGDFDPKEDRKYYGMFIASRGDFSPAHHYFHWSFAFKNGEVATAFVTPQPPRPNEKYTDSSMWKLIESSYRYPNDKQATPWKHELLAEKGFVEKRE